MTIKATMTWADLKSGVKKFFSAYARVAYVMLIVFGGEVISRYSHEKCQIEFASGNFVVRDNINYVLFASLFCYASGTMLFTTESKNEITQQLSQYLKLLSAILACTTIILTQMAVFVSHCDADDKSIDGEVDGLYQYAVILFTLMVAHSISNTQTVNKTGEAEDTNPKIHRWFQLSNWIIRILFVSFLLDLVSHGRFNEESLNGRQQKKSSCIGAMDVNHEEFEWYKHISLTDFQTVNLGGKTLEMPHDANPTMYALLWSVLGLLIVEAFFKALSYFEIYKMQESYAAIILGDLHGLAVDISLALVLFSLTFANDIAACPIFDPWESRARTVFVIAAVYIGFQFFMDMARFMNINITIDMKPSNHMYTKFMY